MILNDIKTASQYLPSLNLDLGNERFTDFFRRAQEWLVSHILGANLEHVLEADIPVTKADPYADLRRHCQRIIAEKALLDAIPEMDMQLTEAGFAVQNNSDFSPASAQRVERLMAKLPERIASDVDAVVRYLLEHSIDDDLKYNEWRETDQFKHLTAVFMPLFDTCNGYCINSAPSYDAYYDALPNMAKELRRVAAYYVSAEELDRLVELYRNDELEDIHLAAVHWLCYVATSAYEKDFKRARSYAADARDMMLSDPDKFPKFKASAAFAQKVIDLDGGKTVNFL